MQESIEAIGLVRLICIPLIGGLTGYLTNYLAVRMLFRPQAEVRIFGIRFQGLVPRRRKQIAESIGQTVEQHLISHDDIRDALDDPEVKELIRGAFDERIDHLIEVKLKGLNPMFAMVLQGDMLLKIKTAILEELMQAVPPMTERIMDSLEERLDFQHIVEEKIEGFDLGTFEDLILRIASRELRAIEILGGVLGFFIGILTVLLLLI